MGNGAVLNAGESAARPTIRDVARLAGVSKLTVSLVLRESASVRPQTAETVRAAMARMNYVYDPRAVRFRQGRPGPLGVALRGAGDPLSAGVLSGLSEVAGKAGQALLVCFGGRRGAGGDTAFLLHAEGASAMLIDARDGPFGTTPGGVPTMALFGTPPGMMSAQLDGAQALRLATEYLEQQGATRFVLAGRPEILVPGAGQDPVHLRLDHPGATEFMERLGQTATPADGIICTDPAIGRLCRAVGVPRARLVVLGDAERTGDCAALCFDGRALGQTIGRRLLDRMSGGPPGAEDIVAPVWLTTPRCDG
ncbi:DNA-binding transcriptional regulator, LacI/PurR family [Roseivivax sediminis]|uniref:DNA-binding transcriptional regulator, LacI/PurR family n=2 Tax=Roseivivax sediminis TaxID=936889 RepID=A0A1I2D055_9RHOB|nr:DNA-binding transcriptional regulator, LacI/PurR family [Roseivivax sediminis]